MIVVISDLKVDFEGNSEDMIGDLEGDLMGAKSEVEDAISTEVIGE